MKKKLEAKIVSIAHQLLKINVEDNIDNLHAEVAELYETLTVLKFTKENMDEGLPTIGGDSSFFKMLDKAFNNTETDAIEVKDKTYVDLSDNDQEEISEPVIEKIKDIVAQFPGEGEKVDEVLKEILPPPKYAKNDFEEITADFKNMPIFEPVKKENEKKATLNDTLKPKGLLIDLNDKVALIKHLFAGNSDDYNRAISQINTSETFEDAKNLIQNRIKPDYNNWEDKTEYETRLLELVEAKFES